MHYNERKEFIFYTVFFFWNIKGRGRGHGNGRGQPVSVTEFFFLNFSSPYLLLALLVFTH